MRRHDNLPLSCPAVRQTRFDNTIANRRHPGYGPRRVTAESIMRLNSFSSPIILFHVLIWLLASASPVIAQVEESVEEADRLNSSNDPLHRLAHTLRPKRVKTVVKKAPKNLRLGTDDFLHSGLKRKTIVGAYSTTAAVGLGGAAVWYQLTNLRSKERDANAKAASEYSLSGAEKKKDSTDKPAFGSTQRIVR